jgi:GT2 family glycosyltransferase
MFSDPLISIIIVTYNSKKDIDECLRAIEDQSYRNFEVIVVDNASSDGTADHVGRGYPRVKLLRNDANLGYSGGNNSGVDIAKGEYIAILNPDVAVDKEWLNEMVGHAKKHPEAGIVASKVVLYDNPRVVNACGNDVHFTGLAFCRGYGDEEGKYSSQEYVLAPSGCSFLTKRKVVRDVGLFDDDFFIDFADIDFAVRCHLMGYKCLLVPSSKVLHKFVLKMNPVRYFVLERGRYLLLLKNFSRRTLVIIFPSLILTEVLTWAFAILRGREYIMAKMAAYRWIRRNWQRIMKKRRIIQKLRRIDDKGVLKLMTYRISIPQRWLKRRALRIIVETFFNLLYFMLYRVTLSLL